MIGPVLLIACLALPAGEAPPVKPTSTVIFYGWSPDSTQVGWALERRGGGRRTKKVWYLRETNRTSHGKARLRASKVPGDVHYPGYYETKGFKLHDLETSTNAEQTRTEIPLRYDRTLVVELKTEEKIRLYYWFEEGADRLLLHKVTFAEIYFAAGVRAWLSPDGRRVALALALDGDIRLDAALVVLVLPVAGWQDDARTEGSR